MTVMTDDSFIYPPPLPGRRWRAGCFSKLLNKKKERRMVVVVTIIERTATEMKERE